MINLVDDFIPLSYQNLIEKTITDNNMPWRWLEHMDTDYEGYSGQFNDIYQEDEEPFRTESAELYYTLGALLCKIQDEILPEYQYYRIRGVMQTPHPTSPKHFIPHVDWSTSGEKSVIYYQHDTTGDTYFFKEEELYNRKLRIKNKKDYKWEPIESVSPKKGRLVVFNSHQYHAGSAPVSGRRLLININYLNNRRNII